MIDVSAQVVLVKTLQLCCRLMLLKVNTHIHIPQVLCNSRLASRRHVLLNVVVGFVRSISSGGHFLLLVAPCFSFLYTEKFDEQEKKSRD